MTISIGFEYNINDLYQEAQRRWLKPAEVMYILQNHEQYQFTQEPPQLPTSGSLFLFNRRVLRFFRRDGHAWRKKRDGRAVGEAHERLKVGNVEAINCYYAHGEQNPTFQRRSYWMLDPAFDHIVLVHYRDTSEVSLQNMTILFSCIFYSVPPATVSTLLISLTCCREGSVLDLVHNCHRVHLLHTVRVLAHIVIITRGQRPLLMIHMNLIRVSLVLYLLKLPPITME